MTYVYYLLLSALLFALGAYGAMRRRSVLLLLMSVELMLNAANLGLITFARAWGSLAAQGAALLVVALAAAEVAVGLALVVAVFRVRESTTVDDLSELKG